MLKEVNGGITAAAGFKAAGVHCGIKKSKKDIALVVSETLATSAGVFTLNKVAAAPVLLDKEHLAIQPAARAFAVNSGNANACTGEQGLRDARAMAQKTAKLIGAKPSEILVSSTGVIGQQMPIEKVLSGIDSAYGCLSSSGHTDAAEGILTTDTFLKEAAVSFTIEGKTVTVGGMAKGSGMIAPNMATMLAFVHNRCQDRPGSAPRDPGPNHKEVVQPDYRGWGHEHERHGARAGKRHRRQHGDCPLERSGLPGISPRHGKRVGQTLENDRS